MQCESARHGADSCSSYPRLLVVSESPFSLDNGFGVTLTNFLQGWPASHLSVFYISNDYHIINRDCNFQKHAKIPGNPRRYFSIPFALGLQAEWRGQYSAKWLNRQLNGFKPELVYTFFHSASTFRFGQWISEKLFIPHVMHVGDESLDITPKTTKLVQLAAGNFAISEPMAKEYQKRYSKQFEVFHNGAAPDYYQHTHPSSIAHKPEKVIRYLGRLYSWLHYDSLRLLSQAVSLCRAEGKNWKIELYGNANEDELHKSGILGDNLIYAGKVGREEGIKLLHGSDLLVLPLTYASETLKNYRFSFPTKLAEYLATGIPVLLLSDPNSASALFSRANSVCHLVSSPDVLAVYTYLSDLWDNPLLSFNQGQRNTFVCRQLFDQHTITKNFQDRLVEIANTKTC